jgi:hypothetical protein
MHAVLPRAVAGRGVLGISAVPRSLAGVRLQLGLGIRAADGRVGMFPRREQCASCRLCLGTAPGRFLALHTVTLNSRDALPCSHPVLSHVVRPACCCSRSWDPRRIVTFRPLASLCRACSDIGYYDILTPWNRVFIEKLIVAHLFNMEPKGTLSCP